MGSLHDFSMNCKSVRNLRMEFSCDVFVETGCFRGNSLSYAKTQGFKQLYSCDIDDEMIEYCKQQFINSKNITIFKDTSTGFLEKLLPSLPDERIMFFLDAHLPEHDKNNGSVLLESDLNFPLHQEIQIINNIRSHHNDIIICDDLRIYEDGPFTGGNWSPRTKFNLPTVEEMLSSFNYKIQRFYSCEGYLLLTK